MVVDSNPVAVIKEKFSDNSGYNILEPYNHNSNLLQVKRNLTSSIKKPGVQVKARTSC